MKTTLLPALAMFAPAAWAGVPKGFSAVIPTLDIAGLMLLIVLVGGVAGWAAKRRRK